MLYEFKVISHFHCSEMVFTYKKPSIFQFKLCNYNRHFGQVWKNHSVDCQLLHLVLPTNITKQKKHNFEVQGKPQMEKITLTKRNSLKRYLTYDLTDDATNKTCYYVKPLYCKLLRH